MSIPVRLQRWLDRPTDVTAAMFAFAHRKRGNGEIVVAFAFASHAAFGALIEEGISAECFGDLDLRVLWVCAVARWTSPAASPNGASPLAIAMETLRSAGLTHDSTVAFLPTSSDHCRLWTKEKLFRVVVGREDLSPPDQLAQRARAAAQELRRLEAAQREYCRLMERAADVLLDRSVELHGGMD